MEVKFFTKDITPITGKGDKVGDTFIATMFGAERTFTITEISGKAIFANLPISGMFAK